MENEIRRYKAFISYRHLPLDLEIAEKVHKTIERFVIPKELRKNGEKKLGYVFRDKDELPIAGNLSANIQTALDNSEFLIVICTPETQKSEWVLNEIRYFIDTHDRDHVLAVLADGLPDESFPSILTEIVGEDGSVFSKIEPLAANVVADTPKKRDRLLKTESLRLLAALVGCPYDALFKREQRYRRRRRTIITAAAAAIVFAFMGMLINRNHEINLRLQESLINESNALSAVSKTLYDGGQYSKAVETAVQALPSPEEDRPYVPEAENTLANELNLYHKETIDYVRSFSLDVQTSRIALSKDGRRIAVVDDVKNLHLVDCDTGITQWSIQLDNKYYKELFLTEQTPGILLTSSDGTTYFLNRDTGETVWSHKSYVTHNETLGLCVTYQTDYSTNESTLFLLELATGKELKTFSWTKPDPDGDNVYPDTGAISDDGRYMAVSLDGYYDAALLVFDLETGKLCLEEMFHDQDGFMYTGHCLAFNGNHDLAYAFDSDKQDALVNFYDCKDGWKLRHSSTFQTKNNSSLGGNVYYWSGGIDLLTCAEGYIIFADYLDVYYIDQKTGELAADIQLPSAISSCHLVEKGRLSAVLKNGLITACRPDGNTGAEVGSQYYNCGFNIDGSTVNGSSFSSDTFALIPSGAPTTITILREAENPRLEEVVPSDDFPFLSTCLTSPSGKLVTMLNVDTSTDPDTVVGTLRNIESGQSTTINFVPEENFSFRFVNNNETYLTDDGKLYSTGMVYDVYSRSFRWVTENGQRTLNGRDDFKQSPPHSAALYTVERIDNDSLTLHDAFRILKDGEECARFNCPDAKPDSGYFDYKALCVSGEKVLLMLKVTHYNADPAETFSYLVYNIAEDTLTTLQIPEDMELGHYNSADDCFAMAENQPLLAFRSGENIDVYNTDTGELAASVPHGWYEGSISTMRFAWDDTLLFVFTTEGRIMIFDTAAMEQLSVVTLDDGTFSFLNGDLYQFYPLEDQDRLLLVYVQDDHNIRSGIMFQRSDWSVVGTYNGIVSYLPETNEVLVYPYLRSIYRGSLLTGDEIAALGREYVAAGTAAEQGSEESK